MTLDELQRLFGSSGLIGRGGGIARDIREDILGGDAGQLAQLLDRGDLDGRRGILEIGDGDGFRKSLLHAAIGFLRDPGFENREVSLVLEHAEFHHGGAAGLRIGIIKGHQVHGVLDDLLEPHVGIHGVEIIGKEGLGLPLRIHEVAAGVDPDGLLLAIGILGVLEHHRHLGAIARIDQEDAVIGPCDENLADEVGVGIGEGGDIFLLLGSLAGDGLAKKLANGGGGIGVGAGMRGEGAQEGEQEAEEG